ncbi:hypothetical protein EJ110_NYTH36836 [Nymphaea thermarum]|nr:hypothetical protein EJ110_NYTH36836 [Nymphaea thermarum]
MGEEEEKGSLENHDSRRRRRVEIAGFDTMLQAAALERETCKSMHKNQIPRLTNTKMTLYSNLSRKSGLQLQHTNFKTVVLYEGSIIEFDRRLYGVDIGTCLEKTSTVEEFQDQFEDLSCMVENWPYEALMGAFMLGLKDEIRVELKSEDHLDMDNCFAKTRVVEEKLLKRSTLEKACRA